MEWFLKRRRGAIGHEPFDVVATIDTNPELIQLAIDRGWIPAGSTKMTAAQCRAVSNVSVSGLNALDTFEEFQYFTNITSFVGDSTQQGTNYLTVSKIELPSTLKNISNYMFINATIDKLDLRNVTAISYLGSNTTINKLVWTNLPSCSYYIDNSNGALNLHIVRLDINNFESFLSSYITGNQDNKSAIQLSDYVYINNVLLENITIPSSITTINQNIFRGSTTLQSVILHKDITTIQYSAFRSCLALTEVRINTENYVYPVTIAFGANAFDGCSNLAKYTTTMRNIVTSTYANATSNPLYYSKKLWLSLNQNPSWYIQRADYSYSKWGGYVGVTSLPNYCFINLDINELSISDSLTSIGTSAFEGSTINKFTSSNSTLTSVGSRAFYNCTNLTTLNVNLSGTIEGSAFRNCTNLVLSIPATVTKINSYAFYGCKKLETVTLTSTACSDHTFANASIKKLITSNLSITANANFSNNSAVFDNATINKWEINSGAVTDDFSLTRFDPVGSGAIWFNNRATVGIINLLGELTILNRFKHAIYVICNKLLIQETGSVASGTLVLYSTVVVVSKKMTADFTNISLNSKSSITCYVPYGATGYDTLGFGSVVEVGTNNPVTIDGTTYTDIDDLATALWEDTND